LELLSTKDTLHVKLELKA